MDNNPIGIFDSGVGGLTVVAEIIKFLPNENLIYFGDTARFPYGTKPPELLQKFTSEITEFLIAQKVKAVVIACNSASAAALETARRRFNLPLIGVIEPGARAAIRASKRKRVGVIGTEATITSGAYVKAIKRFDQQVKVFSQECPELADFVERGELRGPRVERLLADYLNPLIRAGIDCLILGCTHYPLLAETIKKVAGSKISLISSAEETASELKEFLTVNGLLRQDLASPVYRFISSGEVEAFKQLGVRFLGRDIEKVERYEQLIAERVIEFGQD